MYGKVRKQGQDFALEPEHVHEWRLHLLHMNLEEEGMLDMGWWSGKVRVLLIKNEREALHEGLTLRILFFELSFLIIWIFHLVILHVEEKLQLPTHWASSQLILLISRTQTLFELPEEALVYAEIGRRPQQEGPGFIFLLCVKEWYWV